MNIEEQTEKYNELLARHLKEIPGKMFVFEITKCCNYSTFVYLYKEDKLLDLYVQVAKHFDCNNVQSLYILNPFGERIPIPFNSHTTLKEFIFINTQRDSRNFVPVYDLPLPVVYRIYFNDGHHCCLPNTVT
jgi:hypothetical protein